MKFFIVLAGLLSLSQAEEKVPASTSPLVYTALPNYAYAPYAPGLIAPHGAIQYSGLILPEVKPEEKAENEEEKVNPLFTAGVTYAGIAPATPVVANVYAAAPVYASAFPHSTSSQFHAQDEFKNTNYGYNNINSAKFESGNGNLGVAQGGYQYVDANGILQTVNYVADVGGFRVVDSRLPVAPEAPEVTPLEAPVFTGEAPKPVELTPEVKAATDEHLATFEEVQKSRSKRESDPGLVYGFAGGYLPYTYGAGYIRPNSLRYGLAPYPYQVGYGPRAFYYSY